MGTDTDGVFSFGEDIELGLTLNEYQELAMDTAIYPDKFAVIYPALKLAGEAGEFAEKIGKRLRDADGDFDADSFRMAAAKELGDVLWYVAAAARDLGLYLEDIAEMNLSKLANRMERGVIGGSGDER